MYHACVHVASYKHTATSQHVSFAQLLMSAQVFLDALFDALGGRDQYSAVEVCIQLSASLLSNFVACCRTFSHAVELCRRSSDFVLQCQLVVQCSQLHRFSCVRASHCMCSCVRASHCMCSCVRASHCRCSCVRASHCGCSCLRASHCRCSCSGATKGSLAIRTRRQWQHCGSLSDLPTPRTVVSNPTQLPARPLPAPRSLSPPLSLSQCTAIQQWPNPSTLSKPNCM